MSRLYKVLLVLSLTLAWLAGPAQAMPTAGPVPGDLDKTFAGFGVEGVVSGAETCCTLDMALQADGKIVTAGYVDTRLLVRRYLSNGAVDTSFGSAGKAVLTFPGFSATANSVAVQADGKIILAGQVSTSPSSFLLARLTTHGTLDPTFGGSGFVTTDFDNDIDSAYAVLVQPDGKIIAAGYANVGGDLDFAVARYDLSGGLDSAFGGDGKVTIGFGAIDVAYSLALQDDGKLVVVGVNQDVADGDYAIARLHPNGTLDTSFGGDGKVTTGFGSDEEEASAVAIQPDGRLVVVGHSSDGAVMARYLDNGNLDVTFSGDGKHTVSGDSFWDVAVQPDSQIVILGSHKSPDNNKKLAYYRLNPNGTPDLTFGGDGDAITELDGAAVLGYSLLRQPDGRLLAMGAGNGHVALVRLWPDARLDTGGQQTLGFADPLFGLGSDETAYAMARQPDGKFVVAGEALTPANTESDLALARFLPDGQLDPAFGDHGHVVFGIGQYDTAKAVAIQPDGKIVVAGYSDPPGAIAKNFLLVRFNADGSKDEAFGFLGFRIVDFLGGDDYGNALALAPDGKIVVAGPVWNGVRFVVGVARFTAEGAPDASLGGNGLAVTEWVGHQPNWVSSVLVQPDGGIVVGGSAGADFALLRFTAGGNMDPDFGTLGVTYTNMGGSDYLNALRLTPAGWIIAAGGRSIDGLSDFALAQYTANGVLTDAPEGWPGGKAFMDWGGSEAAFALDVRADGQVVAAGCTAGGLAWAQLLPSGDVALALKGTTDLVGSDECASAVVFAGSHQLVTAGSQRYNGDANMALARFEASVQSDVPISGLSAVNSSPNAFGQSTAFTANLSDGTNVTYEWDFGDGLDAAGKNVFHTYGQAGIYSATVTAINNSSRVTVSTLVTINLTDYVIYLPLVVR